jgi:predicted O-linked N-acetylglucosamine transferase (SPINDLY family)
VGYFLIGALENLDRSRWQTVCYCDRTIQDDLTTRFQAASTLWRDVSALSDQELAEQVRADHIDILFDLAGHTAKNRLLVARPQASRWLK